MRSPWQHYTFPTMALLCAAVIADPSDNPIMFHSDRNSMIEAENGKDYGDLQCENFDHTSLPFDAAAHCPNYLSTNKLGCNITKLNPGFTLSSTMDHNQGDTQFVFFTKPRINKHRNVLLLRYSGELGTIAFDSNRDVFAVSFWLGSINANPHQPNIRIQQEQLDALGSATVEAFGDNEELLGSYEIDFKGQNIGNVTNFEFVGITSDHKIRRVTFNAPFFANLCFATAPAPTTSQNGSGESNQPNRGSEGDNDQSSGDENHTLIIVLVAAGGIAVGVTAFAILCMWPSRRKPPEDGFGDLPFSNNHDNALKSEEPTHPDTEDPVQSIMMDKIPEEPSESEEDPMDNVVEPFENEDNIEEAPDAPGSKRSLKGSRKNMSTMSL